jgi:hypothetical protein
VRVTDSGFPALSATTSVTIVVREVNQAPVFAAIPNVRISEGSNFVFLATATDPDLPANAITYALAAGAPEGAAIGPVSGIFTWRPDYAAGPSTNRITLLAIDNGSPRLTNSASFDIVVRDTAADFILAVGSTNVFGGESNSVPLRLRTDLAITELEFSLNLSTSALTNLSLLGLAPEVVGNTLTPLDSAHSTVRLLLDGTVPVTIDRTIGRLGFLASSNGPSSVTVVRPLDPLATGVNATAFTDAQIGVGHVVVVNREPVLLLENPLAPVLSLYGHPGRAYAVESGLSVPADASWQTLTNVVLPGRFLQWNLDPTETGRFYQAVE